MEEDFSEKRGYSSYYRDDSTIDLQSIADRPDRIQNGTDISGWSHMHTESRASFMSSSTRSHSTSEPEPIDSFFRPASRPPSHPPTQYYQAPSSGAVSPQSPTQDPIGNSARKRIRPDAARHGPKNSRSGSVSKLDGVSDDELAEPGRSGSSTTLSEQRRSRASPTEHSRGRLSVSTLASNSSTIRLSWQERDVSPVSVRDGDRTPNESTSALTSVPSDDEIEADDGNANVGARARHAEEQTTSPNRRGDMLRADGVGRFFQGGSVSIVNTTGESKGKKKAENKGENTGSRRAWLQRRYSLLGGKT